MSVATRLEELVAERERVLAAFLEAEGEPLAHACHDLARRLSRGGTLIAHGVGPAATDAAHVAVEFMHPVIVGKRALPALALPNDPARAATLGPLGHPDDIALAIAHGPPDERLAGFLADARRRGMLTIALTGGEPIGDVDHAFAVPTGDPAIVQEVQETAYHVLWELVHVFFEHPGLLAEACITCGDVAVEATVVAVRGATATIERDGAREDVAVDLVGDVSVGDVLLCHAGVALEKVPEPAGAPPEPAAGDTAGFLYPFLEGGEDDLDGVLADVRASTLRKGADTVSLRARIDTAAIERCAAAVRERLEAGGRLLTFGNGGSATDAQDLAADALVAGWPAAALVNDASTVTAVANDVGFANTFSRQLIALGRPGDVAVALSTSGSSANVVAGLEEARRRGLLTCAILGYGGGALTGHEAVDHVLAVEGDYVPRLQEAHATIYHLLLEAIGGRS